MFIWLASYPKSGNTLVRSLLASYFFTKDGSCNFEILKNILQFPERKLFIKNGINCKNEMDMIRNYIKVQESINKKDSVQFMKTHSYLFNIENNPFTNLDNSLGVVYIVRDPRNVLISASNHNQTSHKKTLEQLVNGSVMGKNEGEGTLVYTGNWASNYKSWKSFESVGKYLLIKYEDLIFDKEKTFLKILNFIHKISKKNFILDKTKFKNVINTTDFGNMQKMENETEFHESMIDNKTGKKIKFFYLGPKNDWRKSLDNDIQKNIEVAFKNEMIQLGYL